MTPEERAEEIKQELCLRGRTVQIEVEFIAHHIHDAIREERERCAKMVENYTIEAGQSRPSRQEIAAAIRKQGE